MTLDAKNTARSVTLFCICTLGKNDNLAKLVADIDSICSSRNHDIRIAVIVNSSTPLEFELPTSADVSYFPEVGYSSVRNYSLQKRKSAENLYFIDDDEVYSSLDDGGYDPLEMMLQASFIYPDSLLTGPVFALDEVDFQILERTYRNTNPSFKTGQIVNYVSGGNLFIPASVFETREIYFDTTFNFGGEDKELSDRMASSGTPSRWVEQAQIYELAPKQRTDSEWLLERESKNRAIYYLSGCKNFGLAWKVNFSIQMTAGLCLFWLLKMVRGKDENINYQYAIRKGAFRKISQIRSSWKSK